MKNHIKKLNPFLLLCLLGCVLNLSTARNSHGEGNRLSPDKKARLTTGYHSPNVETLRRLSQGRVSDILIGSSSLGQVHQTIAHLAENPGRRFVSVVEQKIAQEELDQLLGQTIALPIGRFFFNRSEEAPPEKPVETLANLIQIEKEIEIQKSFVTVGQYERLMGMGDRLALLALCRIKKYDYPQAIRPEGPIQYLTHSEEDRYIFKLSEKILALWPIAHPDRDLPVVRRPTQDEWLYANSRPIDPYQILFGKTRYEINAVISKPKGGIPNITVNGTSGENARGFIGLGTVTREVTSTVFEDNIMTQLTRGSPNSENRPFAIGRKYHSERAAFGLRLVLDFSSGIKAPAIPVPPKN